MSQISKKLLVLIVVCFMSLGTFSSAFAEFKEPSFPTNTNSAELTWWTWTQNAELVVKEFNKVYPNIKVKVENVGTGGALLTKLLTAINAGSGAPDITQIPYDALPQIYDSGGLVDITEYVSAYRDSLPEWSWNLTTFDDKIIAVPEDGGSLALAYNLDIYEKYGLSIPKTWAEYAENAKKFRAANANPDEYYSYLPIDGEHLLGYIWQSGARPFYKSENGWVIRINSPEMKKLFGFWEELIQLKAVAASPNWTPEWSAAIAKGAYANIVIAAWGPEYMVGSNMKPPFDKWNLTDIPQWKEGQFVTGNYGGSSDAVTTQSKHPAEAALFAAWMNTSKAGVTLGITPATAGGRGFYPASNYLNDIPVHNEPVKAMNGQLANAVFAKSSAAVENTFVFSPWSTFVASELGVLVKAFAVEGTMTTSEALDDFQGKLIEFAKSQNYEVDEAASAGETPSVDGTETATATDNGTTDGGGSSPGILMIIVMIVLILLAIIIIVARRTKK